MQLHTPAPRRDNARPPGAKFERVIADEARFLRNWLRNPLVTGAVSPSGRFLARTMARFVDPLGEGPVIELGPGTGPVTNALVAQGIAPHRLILVEFDADFCALLRRRFPLITVIQGDAYNLAKTLQGHLSRPAAAIVSSLPLLTKPEHTRAALLEQALGFAEPGAPFIQFTYGAKPPIPRRLSNAAFTFATEGTAPVWLNLPPARVWIYRRAASSAEGKHRSRADEFMRGLRVRGVKVRRDIKRAAGKLGTRPKEKR